MSNPKAKETTVITDIDDAPEAAVKSSASTAVAVAITDNADAFSGEKVELKINSGEGAAGRQGVFLGINGHGLNIPRDKWVIVAQEVVDQLENCTMTIYEPIEGGTVRESEVSRFSYSVRPIRAQ